MSRSAWWDGHPLVSRLTTMAYHAMQHRSCWSRKRAGKRLREESSFIIMHDCAVFAECSGKYVFPPNCSLPCLEPFTPSVSCPCFCYKSIGQLWQRRLRTGRNVMLSSPIPFYRSWSYLVCLPLYRSASSCLESSSNWLFELHSPPSWCSQRSFLHFRLLR